MSKKVTIAIELEDVISEGNDTFNTFNMDDFVEDLLWAVKEAIDEKLEGFADWHAVAIKDRTNKRDFAWSNSVLNALVKARTGVSCKVESVEYAEVEE